MASRYQKVTDVEKALRYCEAGLLYRKWPSVEFGDMSLGAEYVPVTRILYRYGASALRINVEAGHMYILVEEDDNEEQPIG